MAEAGGLDADAGLVAGGVLRGGAEPRGVVRPHLVADLQPAAVQPALTQPEAPEAKIRGSQKGLQWIILGLERVTGVLKGVQRGTLEVSALYFNHTQSGDSSG